MTILLFLIACASNPADTADTAWDTAFEGLYCCEWLCKTLEEYPNSVEVDHPSECAEHAARTCGDLEPIELTKRECSTFGA